MPDLGAIDGLVVGSVVGDIATARLPLSSLDQPRRGARHRAHRAPRTSCGPCSTWRSRRPTSTTSGAARPAYTGAGVLVGIIDSGIDWRHDDFRNANGTTRLKAIWDLWGAGSAPPTGFAYGAEWDQTEINASLTGGGAVNEVDNNGHGTHVSGIAAGNGRASSGQYSGVAPEADLLFAKPFNNGGFAEDKTIDAMNYLVQKAHALGQPIAINMSLGGHFGAHDGTSAQERVIDDLSGPGVVFCVAAGNEGENYLAEAGAGRQPRLRPARARPTTPRPAPATTSGWSSSGTRATTSPTVSLTDQRHDHHAGPVRPDRHAEHDRRLHHHRQREPGRRPRQRRQALPRSRSTTAAAIDVAAIDWTINVDGGAGNAHAWLVQSTMTAGFPNSDQSYSLGMPACAESAVSVAAWKTRNTWPGTGGTFGYTRQLGRGGDRRAARRSPPRARRATAARSRTSRRPAWRSSPATRRTRIRPPRPRCACPATTTG